MAENIVHLVLARVVGAPEGVKGISLFIVPKFLVDADGSLGRAQRRLVRQHRAQARHQGQPDRGAAVRRPGGGPGRPGAIGNLIGEENRGLEYMFIMMNAARYAVGMQGIAVAERAYQKAAAFAQASACSRARSTARCAGSATDHPPPRRAPHADDDARLHRRLPRDGASSPRRPSTPRTTHPDAEVRKQNQAFYEFMVPLVKGYSTEMSIEVASLGVQVHGGMGFIEETGAAQYLRDARILTIYEGTTAIQANDLVGRKTARDGGRVARGIAAQIARDRGRTRRPARAPRPGRCCSACAPRARRSSRSSTSSSGRQGSNPNAVFAGSVPYLMLAGNLMAGWQMARALLVGRDAARRRRRRRAPSSRPRWRRRASTPSTC